MSLALFTVLLSIGDLAAVITLSASMRTNEPKFIDGAFAVVRCILVVLALSCTMESSKWRLICAFLITLAVAPAYYGVVEQSENHAKIDFFVSLAFGLCESFLLVLIYSLSPAPVKEVSEALRQSLLEEGHQTLAAKKLHLDPDPYKGQGASFRRLVSLAYPERYILAVASFALFISSAASIVTPAVRQRICS